MQFEESARDVTKHMLGPHVVGQRIVVRRLLRGQTGPSGGPAFTDLLGVCVAWAEACVVQPESGPPVRIPVADIVSGKPVPPRPSVRLRVSPATAQLHGSVLWPDLETERIGEHQDGWVLRRSAGSPNRRANSVLALGPSGVDDAVEQTVAFYRAHGQRPIAAVLPGSPEERLLTDAGWVRESGDADTLFQIASVARALRAARGSAPLVELVETPAADERTVTVRAADHASGLAAYADDWLGIRSVDVSPDHRRRGLGRAVVAALLEWGAERGATTAYLHVLADNAPAIGLYEVLGFTTHHAYRYLATP